MSRARSLTIWGIEGLPEIVAGDDLGALIAAHATLRDGDVVVVAQKIVSKTEGRVVTGLREEIIRSQTRRVVAARDDVAILETEHGFVCANAGVDESNVEAGRFVLLPADPDASAASIRATLRAHAGCDVGVVVADTFGRPWRLGQVNVAIGVAGLAPLDDLRGTTDRNGRTLTATIVAIADELASAAELVMGKADGVPVAVVRGLAALGSPGAARDLVRPASEDLFATGIGGDPPA